MISSTFLFIKCISWRYFYIRATNLYLFLKTVPKDTLKNIQTSSKVLEKEIFFASLHPS